MACQYSLPSTELAQRAVRSPPRTLSRPTLPNREGDDQNGFVRKGTVLCQVLELGLCAVGFASAGRQYTTLMYTGTASGIPKLKLDTAIE